MGGPREVYDAHVQLQFEADDIENAPTLKACLYLVRFPVSLAFILLRESASFPFTFNSGQPLSRSIGANWNCGIVFGFLAMEQEKGQKKETEQEQELRILGVR